jgi:hypothetical protein
LGITEESVIQLLGITEDGAVQSLCITEDSAIQLLGITENSAIQLLCITEDNAVQLLGITEDSAIIYLWGMNPLAYLAYFYMLKHVYYILVCGVQRLLVLDGDSLIDEGSFYCTFYPITIAL